MMSRNKYTVSEFVGNAWSYLLTKIVYPKARLIRRPVYMRGIKSLEGANVLTTGHACRFDLPGNRKTLFIGNECEFGDYVHIVAHERVDIGNNVLMASKVFISDTDHGIYKGEIQDSPSVKPNDRRLVSVPVKIGDNVWIGENVVILAGSTIGNGCIIGANSVVKGEVPMNTIAVGSPIKCVKKFNIDTNKWEKI